jgi:hypothetical protein
MNSIGSLACRQVCVTIIQLNAGAVWGIAGRTTAAIPMDITTARITRAFFPNTIVSVAHREVALIMGTCQTSTNIADLEAASTVKSFTAHF